MVIQRLEEFFKYFQEVYTMWVPLPKNQIYIYLVDVDTTKVTVYVQIFEDHKFWCFAVKVSSTKLLSSKFHWQNYLIVEQDTREMDSWLH